VVSSLSDGVSILVSSLNIDVSGAQRKSLSDTGSRDLSLVLVSSISNVDGIGRLGDGLGSLGSLVVNMNNVLALVSGSEVGSVGSIAIVLDGNDLLLAVGSFDGDVKLGASSLDVAILSNWVDVDVGGNTLWDAGIDSRSGNSGLGGIDQLMDADRVGRLGNLLVLQTDIDGVWAESSGSICEFIRSVSLVGNWRLDLGVVGSLDADHKRSTSRGDLLSLRVSGLDDSLSGVVQIGTIGLDGRSLDSRLGGIDSGVNLNAVGRLGNGKHLVLDLDSMSAGSRGSVSSSISSISIVSDSGRNVGVGRRGDGNLKRLSTLDQGIVEGVPGGDGEGSWSSDNNVLSSLNSRSSDGALGWIDSLLQTSLFVFPFLKESNVGHHR